MAKHTHKHKHIYFIRHAESGANVKNVFSSPDTPLSEGGKEQAHRVLDNCSAIPFDIILASDYRRTQETARHINERTGKEIVFNELIREWRPPHELIGKDRGGEEAARILDELEAHGHEADWHYSDEENFTEFRARIVDALDMIRHREEDHILVVTHSTAMKMMVAVMVVGADLHPETYYKFSKTLTAKNTGITYVRYGVDWELVTWNNFSHLSHVQ